MAKFCENCGAPLTEGARFCENCGSEIKNAPVLPNTTATEAIRRAEENNNSAGVSGVMAGTAAETVIGEKTETDGTLAHEAERFDHKMADEQRESMRQDSFEKAEPQRNSSAYVEEQGWQEMFFSTKNRLNRKRYLIRAVELWAVTFVISFVAAIVLPESLLSVFVTFFGLVTTGSSISLGVRRCHDVGKSGWWMLLIVVPVVNFFWGLYLFFQAGEIGDNEYGPDPLGGQWQ